MIKLTSIRAKSKLGTTLVESVVTIGILSVMAVAIVTLAVTVLSVNISARLKSRATGYVEADLEQIRGYFQTTMWSGLSGKATASPGGGATCYTDGTLSMIMSSCPGGSQAMPTCQLGQMIAGGVFSQFVKLTQSGTSVFVQAFVGWPERGACQKTEVDTYYYSY